MVKGVNPLRYLRDAESEGDDTGWMDAVRMYVIPGMIVLAIVGVGIYQLSSSGGTGTSLFGDGNVFQSMGKAMFSLK
jgi:hypothetical protein